jgi:thiol-disulfide isomerase/thioredoxin
MLTSSILRYSAPALLLWACLCLSLPARSAGVEEGQPAPAVELPVLGDESGATTSLESLRGKVVYVDFWASWCGPCRLSFPVLDELYKEFAAQGFEVLAINVDEVEDEALEFLQEVPVSYRTVRDDSGATPQAYGILGMPTGFLVDRQGVVRKVHQGFRKSDGEKLRGELIELLGQ